MTNDNIHFILAKETVVALLVEARAEIDKEFGEGYAIQNPTLVSAFVTAASQQIAVSNGGY